MGNLCLSPEQQRNQAVIREMEKAREMERGKIKILLLGTGESGKSTLFKQMRLLYGIGDEGKKFTEGEKNTFRKVIYGNIVSDSRQLFRVAMDNHRITDEEIMVIGEQIQNWKRQEPITPKHAAMLHKLWADRGIQEQWRHRMVMTIQDAFKYYMESIDRIASEGWEPTNQDILRSRARTTGVVQANFKIHNTKFEMYDVGGQKNERRKWIDQFGGVTTVLFIAAISDYNQFLYEDRRINRQDESVEVLKTLLHYECFKTTPFILFMNKDDLFREKLTQYPFRVTEQEAAGNEELEARNLSFQPPYLDLRKRYALDGSNGEFEEYYQRCINYLSDLYVNQAPPERLQMGKDPHIYVHVTNSTDTENVKKIMDSCRDIILKGELTQGGWI